MPKKVLLLLAAAIFILAACQSQPEPGQSGILCFFEDNNGIRTQLFYKDSETCRRSFMGWWNGDQLIHSELVP